MTKLEFLNELGRRISQLPPDEIDRRLFYYAEMLDDMTEDGMSEEEAVSRLGSPAELAGQILKEAPLSTLMRSRMKPKEGWSGLKVLLLVLGAPVWVPLMGVFFVLIGVAYVVLWVLVIALFALVISLGCSGGALLAACVFWNGGLANELLWVGAGLVCVGVCIPGWLGAVAFGKWIARVSGKLGDWVKSLFIKKEETV